ncbi:MAG: acyltransferase, partial [Oscillospiraceae bacterium]|nr:acyltransferase [Oscillospiraceae bacterium]
ALRLPFSGNMRHFSLDALVRTGYLFVDLMLLLSAFCLVLPHARAMVLAEPVPSAKDFYKKRLARILPPYYLSVLLLFFIALFSGAYTSFSAAAKDLLATLSFTQTLFPSVFFYTKLNGVLWTAAIEMQFYLIFPLLAAAFRKKPLISYLSMLLAAFLYLHGFALARPETLRATLNQLPAFFAVFANGMMAAYLYVLAVKALKNKKAPLVSVSAVLGCVIAILLLRLLMKGAASAEVTQIFQARYRFPLSLVFTLLLLSLAFGGKLFSLLFGNPLMRFLALISYNLYIWHQWIAVQLKQWRIPYWEGTELPNMAGNRVWQERYTLIVAGGEGQ